MRMGTALPQIEESAVEDRHIVPGRILQREGGAGDRLGRLFRGLFFFRRGADDRVLGNRFLDDGFLDDRFRGRRFLDQRLLLLGDFLRQIGGGLLVVVIVEGVVDPLAGGTQRLDLPAGEMLRVDPNGEDRRGVR